MRGTRATLTLTVATALLLVGGSTRAGPASFQVIGPLPGLDIVPSAPVIFTMAISVSDDGRVVAGYGLVNEPPTPDAIVFRYADFRFRDGNLDTLPPPHHSQAVVTPDGSKILAPAGAGIWVWEGDSTSRKDLTGQVQRLWNVHPNPDGSVIVGQGDFAGFSTGAYRYANETVTRLVDPTGTDYLFGANAVSADGSIVAGFTQPNRSFRLDIDDDSIQILDSLGPGLMMLPSEMTPDGEVIVGIAEAPSGFPWLEAFRWENGQTMGLGLLAGHANSGASDVSADGRVVVGGTDPFGWEPRRGEAWIWDPDHGMRSLEDVLSENGVDLTGWELRVAFAVSADGRTVVGKAEDAQFDDWAFVARVPGAALLDIDVRPGDPDNRICTAPRLPIPVAILGSEEVDVRDVDVTTLAFGPGEAAPALDLTHPLVYRLSLLDVNDDGEKDLVAAFRCGETGLPLGESDACLTGKIGGLFFEACDTARVELPGCGLGAELALLLPPLLWLWGRRRLAPRCPGWRRIV